MSNWAPPTRIAIGAVCQPVITWVGWTRIGIWATAAVIVVAISVGLLDRFIK